MCSSDLFPSHDMFPSHDTKTNVNKIKNANNQDKYIDVSGSTTSLFFFKGNNEFLHNCKILNVNKINELVSTGTKKDIIFYICKILRIFFLVRSCVSSTFMDKRREKLRG